MTILRQFQDMTLHHSWLSRLGLRVLFVIVACSQFPLPVGHAHELGQTGSEMPGGSLMPAGLIDHLDRYHGNQFLIASTVTNNDPQWHVHFLMPWQLGIDCSLALVGADMPTATESGSETSGFVSWLGFCDLTGQDQGLANTLDLLAGAVLIVSLDQSLSPHGFNCRPIISSAKNYLESFTSVSPHALLCVLRC